MAKQTAKASDDQSQDSANEAEADPQVSSTGADPQPSRLPQAAHDLGSISSIASLIISIYVAFKVGSITRHYRELGLNPKFAKTVKGHIKNLDNQFKSKDWVAIKKEAASIYALCQQAVKVTSSLSKQAAKQCLTVAESVRNNTSESLNLSEAEKLVHSLTVLQSHLASNNEIQKWQSKI